MASPFSVFRSNLKPLMVALTLLSLFAFVALPALQMYQQYNVSGVANPDIATYDGGSFSEAEIGYFNRTHAQSTRFLTAVAEQVIQRGGTPRVPGFQIDPRTGQILSVGISTMNSPRTAVLTQLHAERAADLGLALDNAAIDQWMELFTDGKLSQNELAGIRAQVSQNLLGQSQLYDHLRTELLANLFQRVTATGLSVGQALIVPPAEAWSQFLKLNQEAIVTTYPVLVEEFLDKTSDPTKAEIEALYAEGKERFPNPDSPDPGFRRRYAANVEFVSATIDDFVQSEVAKLSEEEIRAEYERRIQGGDFKLPPTQTPATEEPASEEPATEEPATEEPATEEPATEEPATEEPATEEPATEEPATEEPATEEPATEEPATEEPATEEPAEETPAEETPAEDPADSQSLRASENVFQFVALRMQDEAADEATDSEAEPPADSESEEEVAEPTEPAPATEPTEPAPATEPTEPAPATEPTAPAPATEPAEEAATATRPFEEVRDEIARSMVMGDATRARDKAITEAISTMRSYFTQSALYNDMVKTNPTAAKPERPNLKQLAERLGLRYGETGLKDALTIRETPIGQSSGLGEMMFRRGDPFAVQTYTDEKPLYLPLQTINDALQMTFVSWKTEAREAYIPELSEIREEVVAAAKTIEARKLAEAAAEELAAQANATTEKSIEAVVPENRKNLVFKDLGPFPWYRYFGPGTQPFIAGVPELDNVGEEFMETVFRGELNEFGVGPNNPKTVYYVVKTTDLQPSTEELRTRFMQANQRQATTGLAFEDASQIYGSWADQFEKSINLEWNEEALAQE